MYNYIKGFRTFSPCSNNKSVECISKNNFSFWNNMSCFNRISALTWRHLIFLFLCAIACYQWWVGSEDEINMKRTEMDIYDYLYNEMLYVPMHRITTGSTKEGLRLLSSRCGYILLLIKSPWGLGLHWCKNVRLNYWEGFYYGILRIQSWNGLSTFDEHESIKWCFK